MGISLFTLIASTFGLALEQCCLAFVPLWFCGPMSCCCQDDFEFLIPLPLPPKCSDRRWLSSHLVYVLLRLQPKAFCKIHKHSTNKVIHLPSFLKINYKKFSTGKVNVSLYLWVCVSGHMSHHVHVVVRGQLERAKWALLPPRRSQEMNWSHRLASRCCYAPNLLQTLAFH